MKNYSILFITAALSFSIVGCSSADLDSLTVTEAESIIGDTDSWKVTYYYDKTKDETSDFNGWSFEFLSDGTLNAVNSSTAYSGSWSIENTDDDPVYNKKMVILIAGADPLDNMSDDWLITELTESVMKLQDDSDNGIEELHLER